MQLLPEMEVRLCLQAALVVAMDNGCVHAISSPFLCYESLVDLADFQQHRSLHL
jgi:hypothetical protein